MKRSVVLICLVVMAVASAFGAGLCTDAANIGANVLTPGFSCSLGPLYFSNFTATQSGLGEAPIIWLGTGVSGNLTGFSANVANLYFNTNFNDTVSTLRIIGFSFQVSGPVDMVDGWLGGSGNRSISEWVCLQQGCSEQDAIAALNLTQANTTGSTGFELVNGIWVSKTMTVNVGAGLSHFSQSFHTIPEPLAMVLVGSGLLGLGLLRRRLRS